MTVNKYAKEYQWGVCTLKHVDSKHHRCIVCKPGYFCIHGKEKKTCPQCGGSSICIHGKRKPRCPQCGGSSICIHDKLKQQCPDCGGSQICIHGKRKQLCPQCDGSQICIHNKLKQRCPHCGGSSICIHDKQKQTCPHCGGSSLCQTCKFTRYNQKYKPQCARCFFNDNPDHPKVSNHLTRQRTVSRSIKEAFPEYTITFDKVITGQTCNRYRPDIFFDLVTHVVIVEIDEDCHRGYDPACDQDRTQAIWECVACRPMVFIRFNPDKCKNVKPMFTKTKSGLSKPAKTYQNRINNLVYCIKSGINEVPDKTYTVYKLFY